MTNATMTFELSYCSILAWLTEIEYNLHTVIMALLDELIDFFELAVSWIWYGVIADVCE